MRYFFALLALVTGVLMVAQPDMAWGAAAISLVVGGIVALIPD